MAARSASISRGPSPTPAHSPLRLPKVARSQLDVRPIDWTGLSRRYLNEGELEVLVALVRSVSPRRVLEIGVNDGRTAKALLDHVPNLELYQGIDVLPGYVPSMKVQRKEVPHHPGYLARNDRRFELILRHRGSLDLAAGELQPCDAVFIDGDHGAEAVRHDTELARALVRPGGIVIWHDYHTLPVVQVREVLESLAEKGEPIFHVEGTWIAFLRV